MPAIDTVFINFRDQDGLRADCLEAERDGFTAKLAIHPAQVPVINDVFTPSAEAVAHASAVVAAFDAAGEDTAMYLLDTNGIPYQAIGYIYEDQRFRHVRFTPGQPIKSVSELKALSPSIGDQKLTLLFRCSFGGNVSKFIVGNQVVANFVPALELDQKQD